MYGCSLYDVPLEKMFVPKRKFLDNKHATVNKPHTRGKTEENNLSMLALVFGRQEHYMLEDILFNGSSRITKISIWWDINDWSYSL